MVSSCLLPAQLLATQHPQNGQSWVLSHLRHNALPRVFSKPVTNPFHASRFLSILLKFNFMIATSKASRFSFDRIETTSVLAPPVSVHIIL
jgi:hypothetical protein